MGCHETATPSDTLGFNGDQDAITHDLTGAFGVVVVAVASGDRFLFYDPGGGLPPDHRCPFARLSSGDNSVQASNLNRPPFRRFHIGISGNTYRALFGSQSRRLAADGVVETGHDFTTLDRSLPHPIYAPRS